MYKYNVCLYENITYQLLKVITSWIKQNEDLIQSQVLTLNIVIYIFQLDITGSVV